MSLFLLGTCSHYDLLCKGPVFETAGTGLIMLSIVRNIYVLFLIQVLLSSQPRRDTRYLGLGGGTKFSVKDGCEHLYCMY